MSSEIFDFDKCIEILVSGKENAVQDAFDYIDEHNCVFSQDDIYASSLVFVALTEHKKGFSSQEIHTLIDLLIEHNVDLNSTAEFEDREDSLKGVDLITGIICQAAGKIRQDKSKISKQIIDNFTEIIKYGRYKGWKTTHEIAPLMTPYNMFSSMADNGFDGLDRILPAFIIPIQELKDEYENEEKSSEDLLKLLKATVSIPNMFTAHTYSIDYSEDELKVNVGVDDSDFDAILNQKENVSLSLSITIGMIVSGFMDNNYEKLHISHKDISSDLYEYISNCNLAYEMNDTEENDITQVHFFYFIETGAISFFLNDEGKIGVIISNALYKGVKGIVDYVMSAFEALLDYSYSLAYEKFDKPLDGNYSLDFVFTSTMVINDYLASYNYPTLVNDVMNPEYESIMSIPYNVELKYNN